MTPTKIIVVKVHGGVVEDVTLVEGEADGSVLVLVRDYDELEYHRVLGYSEEEYEL